MKARRLSRAASARAVLAPPMPGLVRCAELPWFPFMSDGVQIKLCRVSLATGEMVLMVRAAPGAGLATHYHHGMFVSYTISGQWRYLETGLMVGPGDVVVKPAGSAQALEVVGHTPAEAFVHLAGALEFRDEDGKTLCIENAETLHGRYLAHCALHGIEPIDVAGGFPG